MKSKKVRRIKQLPEPLAHQIAAGEVVLHPASVVKELVENAIDAASNQIDIFLDDGGMKRLVVRDNGCGIHAEDLPLALKRHATSKIASVDDLQNIRSLGFRGEALPSIGAVARMSIASKTANNSVGSKVEVAASQFVGQEDFGMASGTIVTVDDLFYAIPARRKFMKTTSTEFGRCHQVVKRLALAYANVSFNVHHNGKRFATYPAVEDPIERILQVVGSHWRQHLDVVEASEDERHLKIYFTRGELSFANSRQQYYFLNQRFIQERVFNYAIQQAYHTFLLERRYPGIVLYLQMPPKYFDVNVHPTKEEVRFVRSQELARWLRHTLRERLAANRSFVKHPAAIGTPTKPINRDHHDLQEKFFAKSFIRHSDAANGHVATAAEPSVGYGQAVSALDSTASLRAHEPRGGFADLQIIGQMHNSYIICESADGLVLIDQHAAHERVQFEKLRSFYDPEATLKEANRQQLLQPLVVSLSAAALTLLKDYFGVLQGFGFTCEIFGARELLVRTLPVDFRGDATAFIHEFVEELQEQGDAITPQKRADQTLATLACHSAVRFGDRLNQPTMRALLEDLDRLPATSHCPHGRPVCVQLTSNELAKRFGRSY